MIGMKFGKLTVLSHAGKDFYGKNQWLCRCDCERLKIAVQGLLKSGNTKSCGCIIASGTNRRTHGHRNGGAQSRAYSCWANMKKRCDNPNFKQWKDWGGRGITYDPRWKDFEVFLADMGEPPEGMSLDREDNDGNYVKGNCRWANRATQRRNRRDIHLLELDGEMVCLRDYCTAKGISYPMVITRIYRGWSLDLAVTTPQMRV